MFFGKPKPLETVSGIIHRIGITSPSDSVSGYDVILEGSPKRYRIYAYIDAVDITMTKPGDKVEFQIRKSGGVNRHFRNLTMAAEGTTSAS